jgi:hypothetical protein
MDHPKPMNISSHDWALALTMINQLRETCASHNEKFGALLIRLAEAGCLTGDQATALANDWERSDMDIQDLSISVVDTLLTKTGVFKSERRRTLDESFAQLQQTAVGQLAADQDEAQGT